MSSNNLTEEQKKFLRNMLRYFEDKKQKPSTGRGEKIEFDHMQRGIANKFGVVKHAKSSPSPNSFST
jgi:hypothetical protein